MSAAFIIVAPTQDKSFLRADGEWSAEYPDARLFPNLQAARRKRDTLLVPTAIYSTQQYQQGSGPTVEVAA